MIQDVDTTSPVFPSSGLEHDSLPTDPGSVSWATPTLNTDNGDLAGGLNLVTQYRVDALGRDLVEIDPGPAYNVHFTEYDDVNHEVQVFGGWSWNSTYNTFSATANVPTQVTREDIAGNYVETLTMTDAAPSSPPTAVATIANVQTLSRSLMNNAGQVVETDDYFNVTGLTYTAGTFHLGSAYANSGGTVTGNYLVTLTGYGPLGEVDRTVNPDGTIYRTAIDTLGRDSSVWFGGNGFAGAGADDYVSGAWSPSNPGSMVELSANVYDEGGVGDSNLTESIAFPAGNGDDASNFRVTEFAYNWQDEQVAEKDGALVTEVDSAGSGALPVDGLSDRTTSPLWLTLDTGDESSAPLNRPITYDWLDNLGQVQAEYVYAGDGVSLADIQGGADATTGMPGNTDADDLRAVTSYATDALGRQYQSTQYWVDQGTGLGSLTDGLPAGVNTEVTSTFFDPNGNVITVTLPDPTTSGVSDGPTTRYTYDGLGRTVTIASPAPNNSGDPVMTTLGYDGDSNVISVVSPAHASSGTVETDSTFDSDDRLVAVEQPDPDGGGSLTAPCTVYAYDDAGWVSTVREWAASATSTTTGNVTTFQDDALGRKTAEILPDPSDGSAGGGPETTWSYDADSNVLTITAPAPYGSSYAEVTSYTYSPLDDMATMVQSPDGGTTVLTTTYTHNNLGDLTALELPSTDTTEYFFDVLGNQTSIVQPDATTGDAGEGPITSFTYDVFGSVLSETDPQPTTGTPVDTTTTTGYDGFHRLATVTTDPNNTDTLSTESTTAYHYNLDNELTRLTDPDLNETDYSYFPDGSVSTVTDAAYDPVTLAHYTTTYSYTLTGDVATVTDRANREIDYAYDNLGREVSEIWVGGASDGSGDYNYVITTQYNSQGDVGSTTASDDPATVTSPTNIVEYTYTYDRLHEMLTSDNDGTTGAPRFVLTSVFDSDGNRESLVTTLDGDFNFENDYSYNDLNQVVEITQSSSDWPDKQVDFTYTADSLVDTITTYRYESGAYSLVDTASYGYDRLQRTTEIDYTYSTTTIDELTWTYYDDGLVQSAYSSLNGGSVDYTYDDTGEIATADYSSGYSGSPANETYTYDANGNPAGAYLNTSVSTYGNNQIVNDGTYTFTYDANGNMTSRTLNSDTSQFTDYTWDFRNRLVKAVVHDGGSSVEIDYAYDMYNHLIGRTSTGDGGSNLANQPMQQWFAWDGQNMVLSKTVIDGSTDPINWGENRYLWGPGANGQYGQLVDQLLASDFRYEYGATGADMWAITDKDGSVQEMYYNEYWWSGTNLVVDDAYGKMLGDADPWNDYFWSGGIGFAGSFHDPETGLQYNLNRWYDPAAERWLSQDPANADINTYRYAGNSPTNETDPSGLAPTDDDYENAIDILNADADPNIDDEDAPSPADVAWANSIMYGDGGDGAAAQPGPAANPQAAQSGGGMHSLEDMMYWAETGDDMDGEISLEEQLGFMSAMASLGNAGPSQAQIAAQAATTKSDMDVSNGLASNALNVISNPHSSVTAYDAAFPQYYHNAMIPDSSISDIQMLSKGYMNFAAVPFGFASLPEEGLLSALNVGTRLPGSTIGGTFGEVASEVEVGEAVLGSGASKGSWTAGETTFRVSYGSTGSGFLDSLGFQSAQISDINVTIDSSLTGAELTNTIAHEGVHVALAENFPNLAAASGRLPYIGAFPLYGEEVAAYGYGAYSAGQYGQMFAAPVLAFGSMTTGQTISVMTTGAAFGGLWCYGRH